MRVGDSDPVARSDVTDPTEVGKGGEGRPCLPLLAFTAKGWHVKAVGALAAIATLAAGASPAACRAPRRLGQQLHLLLSLLRALVHHLRIVGLIILGFFLFLTLVVRERTLARLGWSALLLLLL